MPVPSWVQDAVFYQIFPDRFANGDHSNDPPNVQPWGAPPTNLHFQGGDLRGIIDHFDYLLDLGINAIYLNPIFQATSNHRYNTTDYYKIDPKLGDMLDFHSLLDIAHRNGVRVILDGVFNHCGRGFFAFVDVLENRESSPYADWFHIQHYPPDAYSPGEARDYLAWWGIKSLPKFNTNNPSVRSYLLGIARYWIEQGADGWRLDVPNEINDDSFWEEFRLTVKTANQDAYLLGEIWEADPRWIGETHFDGLMNYPVRDCLIHLLKMRSGDIPACITKLEALLGIYPRENTYAMYVPLGSHDTERILTKLDGSIDLVKLAFLFQFAYPGSPAIYYGDEIGLKGGKDPECRGGFPWDETQWDLDLQRWVKKLVTIRKKQPVLRRGIFTSLLSDDRGHCYAFARRLGDETILVVMNASAVRHELKLPVGNLGWMDGQAVENLLGQGAYRVSGDSLLISLPPWGGAWLSRA